MCAPTKRFKIYYVGRMGKAYRYAYTAHGVSTVIIELERGNHEVLDVEEEPIVKTNCCGACDSFILEKPKASTTDN